MNDHDYILSTKIVSSVVEDSAHMSEVCVQATAAISQVSAARLASGNPSGVFVIDVRFIPDPGDPDRELAVSSHT